MIAVLKFMVSFKFDSLPKLEFLLLHHKTTRGSHWAQCCGLQLWAFWVSLNIEVSTLPQWHVLPVWALCDGCQMLECAMFRSYCESWDFSPLHERKRAFHRVRNYEHELKTSN